MKLTSAWAILFILQLLGSLPLGLSSRHRSQVHSENVLHDVGSSLASLASRLESQLSAPSPRFTEAQSASHVGGVNSDIDHTINDVIDAVLEGDNPQGSNNKLGEYNFQQKNINQEEAAENLAALLFKQFKKIQTPEPVSAQNTLGGSYEPLQKDFGKGLQYKQEIGGKDTGDTECKLRCGIDCKTNCKHYCEQDCYMHCEESLPHCTSSKHCLKHYEVEKQQCKVKEGMCVQYCQLHEKTCLAHCGLEAKYCLKYCKLDHKFEDILGAPLDHVENLGAISGAHEGHYHPDVHSYEEGLHGGHEVLHDVHDHDVVHGHGIHEDVGHYGHWKDHLDHHFVALDGPEPLSEESVEEPLEDAHMQGEEYEDSYVGHAEEHRFKEKSKAKAAKRHRKH